MKQKPPAIGLDAQPPRIAGHATFCVSSPSPGEAKLTQKERGPTQ